VRQAVAATVRPPSSDELAGLHRSAMAQADKEQLSTTIGKGASQRARRYAMRTGLSLGSVVEQALLEYLAAREFDDEVSPLARLQRRTGRPSRGDLLDDRRRMEGLMKRRGRPLKL